jgi:hypothetical protein
MRLGVSFRANVANQRAAVGNPFETSPFRSAPPDPRPRVCEKESARRRKKHPRHGPWQCETPSRDPESPPSGRQQGLHVSPPKACAACSLWATHATSHHLLLIGRGPGVSFPNPTLCITPSAALHRHFCGVGKSCARRCASASRSGCAPRSPDDPLSAGVSRL